jgi:hypothetical protein
MRKAAECGKASTRSLRQTRTGGGPTTITPVAGGLSWPRHDMAPGATIQTYCVVTRSLTVGMI